MYTNYCGVVVATVVTPTQDLLLIFVMKLRTCHADLTTRKYKIFGCIPIHLTGLLDYWTTILGWITRIDYWTHIKFAQVLFQLLCIISNIHVHHILSLAY